MSARLSAETLEWSRAGLYWATIAYARAWFGTDGINVRVIAEYGGLTPKLLGRIAAEYRVLRGLNVAAHPVGYVADKLCEVMNRESRSWPDSTLERAAHCRAVLEKVRAAGLVRNDQISLITKLMWFLRPAGWTVFDSYVARGARISPSYPTLQRMQRFYATLVDQGFDALCEGMQGAIETAGFHGLQASRIIDMCLMHRGGMENDYLNVADLRAFLATLPSAARESLRALALSLQTGQGHHPLAMAANREAN